MGGKEGSIQLQAKALAWRPAGHMTCGSPTATGGKRDHWDILQLLGIKSALSITPGGKKERLKASLSQQRRIIPRWVHVCRRLSQRAGIMSGERELSGFTSSDSLSGFNLRLLIPPLNTDE